MISKEKENFTSCFPEWKDMGDNKLLVLLHS